MNVKNVTSKEIMLQRIKDALASKKPNPYPEFKDEALFVPAQDDKDVTFARELTAAGGQFIYCEGEIELVENLLLLTAEQGVKNISIWEKGLQQLVNPYGFPYLSNMNSDDAVDMSITSCEVLVARSGSLFLSNANASGRRLSVIPRIHVVVAKASQMVWDMKDALAYLQRRYSSTLPTMISLVTGPSRNALSAELPKYGAVGPEQLVVLLLEDRF